MCHALSLSKSFLGEALWGVERTMEEYDCCERAIIESITMQFVTVTVS